MGNDYMPPRLRMLVLSCPRPMLVHMNTIFTGSNTRLSIYTVLKMMGCITGARLFARSFQKARYQRSIATSTTSSGEPPGIRCTRAPCICRLRLGFLCQNASIIWGIVHLSWWRHYCLQVKISPHSGWFIHRGQIHGCVILAR